LSKIFDALNKARGEVVDLTMPLIDTAGHSDGGAVEPSPVDVSARKIPYVGALKSEPKRLRSDEVRPEGLKEILFHRDPSGTGADRFRLLRMRLRDIWRTGKLKSILITSPLPEEGKSTTALNLASALMEERGCKVLLVEADLHRGSLNEQLGLNPHSGLTECLQTGINPLLAVRRIDPVGWYFLSRGKPCAGSPTELLQPQELSTILKNLSPYFDWIIIDSPPVLSLSDAVALAQHTDGTLLVVKAGRTPVKAVEDAVARLGRKHVLGVVLNGVEQFDPYSKTEQYSQHAVSIPRQLAE
jgi:capsular exopolysaccharide synthesis family protein